MKIYIGHIDKRLNSTQQKWTDWATPDGIEVRLKEPTDIKAPTFLIQRKSTGYEYDHRHNYIGAPWGFYYIDDVIFETNDLISISTHRDVLATGKDYLKKMSAYLSYCSDTAIASDHELMDDERLGPDIYAGSTELNLSYTPTGNSPLLIEDWFVDSVGDGTVAATIMGYGSGPITWFMSLYEYYILCAGVSGEGPNISSTDILVSKFMGLSWKDALLSAVYMPFKLSAIENHFQATEQNLMWGSVQVTMPRPIHYTVNSFTANGRTRRRALDFIPLAEKSGYEFLKGARYTKVFLETPSGSFDISSDAFIDYSQVVCQESINLVNGEYTLKIYTSKGANTIGVPVGQVTEHLGYDVSGRVNTQKGAKSIGADIAIGAGKVAAVVGASMMTAGGAAVAAGETAGAARAAGFTHKEALQLELMSANKNMVGQNALMTMGSGIVGSFMGGNAGSVGKSCSNSGGITSYFTFNESDQPNSRTNFRIITTTHVPSLIYGEPTSPPPPAPPSPIAPIEYPKFAALHGYPCNKWAALADVADGSYIQAVGASVGKVDQGEVTFTLYPSELSELNSMLNSGIYLDSWT